MRALTYTCTTSLSRTIDRFFCLSQKEGLFASTSNLSYEIGLSPWKPSAFAIVNNCYEVGWPQYRAKRETVLYAQTVSTGMTAAWPGLISIKVAWVTNDKR